GRVAAAFRKGHVRPRSSDLQSSESHEGLGHFRSQPLDVDYAVAERKLFSMLRFGGMEWQPNPKDGQADLMRLCPQPAAETFEHAFPTIKVRRGTWTAINLAAFSTEDRDSPARA